VHCLYVLSGHFSAVYRHLPFVSAYNLGVSAREIFANVLRGYREQNGLTQDQAAKKLTMSLSLYKKIEGCERRPQSDFAKRCDEMYGTPAVFALLHEAVLAEPYPEWFGPRILHEDRAAVIHEWEMRGVPGLLQTEAYARAIFQAGRPYDAPAVIDRGVRGQTRTSGHSDSR
jgi:transcriptional regulator with XRE-family HTH domain